MARVLALALLVALPAAAADIATELRESAQGVLRAEELINTERLSGVSLEREIATLTRLVDSGGLNPLGLAIASMWRGRAYANANWLRMKQGSLPDRAAAQASLADFERVVGTGRDVPEWQVEIANALYLAGVVARNHLEDDRAAYAYWQRCAGHRHAGCLNVMASARLTGAAGVPVDLEASLELHRRVYDTGTDFHCAGAFSALAIAETMYFAGLKSQAVSEYAWLGRAYALLDQLERRMKGDSQCDRARFEITEYLMRLGRGEAKPELLRSAASRTGENYLKPVAEYLLREETRPALEAYLRGVKLKHVACYANFLAYWHADIRKEAARSDAHLKAMAALGGDHCRIQLALVQLKKPR